jgi:hypothetical protein
MQRHCFSRCASFKQLRSTCFRYYNKQRYEDGHSRSFLDRNQKKIIISTACAALVGFGSLFYITYEEYDKEKTSKYVMENVSVKSSLYNNLDGIGRSSLEYIKCQLSNQKLRDYLLRSASTLKKETVTDILIDDNIPRFTVLDEERAKGSPPLTKQWASIVCIQSQFSYHVKTQDNKTHGPFFATILNYFEAPISANIPFTPIPQPLFLQTYLINDSLDVLLIANHTANYDRPNSLFLYGYDRILNRTRIVDGKAKDVEFDDHENMLINTDWSQAKSKQNL